MALDDENQSPGTQTSQPAAPPRNIPQNQVLLEPFLMLAGTWRQLKICIEQVTNKIRTMLPDGDFVGYLHAQFSLKITLEPKVTWSLRDAPDPQKS